MKEGSWGAILDWYFPMSKDLWDPLSEEQRQAVKDVPRQAARHAIGLILLGQVPDAADPDQAALIKAIPSSIEGGRGD